MGQGRMRRLRTWGALLLLLSSVSLPNASPVSFGGEFRSGYYAWQSPSDSVETHHELFERLRLDFGAVHGRLGISAWGLYRADVGKNADYRYFDLYHGYIRWSGVPAGFTAVLGRQWITRSLSSGVLDGLDLSYRHRGMQYNLFAGAAKPMTDRTKTAPDFSKSIWTGGEISGRWADWRVSLAATYQAAKASNYVWQEPSDTVRTLMESDLEAIRSLAQIGLQWTPGPWNLLARSDFDYIRMQLDRLRLRGRFRDTGNRFSGEAEILYKKPRVAHSTLWSIIQNDGMIIGRLNGFWNVIDPIGVGVRYQMSKSGGDDPRHRITVDVACRPLHIGFYFQSAPTTSLRGTAISAEYPWTTDFTTGAAIDFGRYELDQDVGPAEDFLSLRAWARLEPVRHLAMTLELQNYSNWYLKDDFRVWAEIGYRFDLLAPQNAEEMPW